ncbi:MAG: NAD-dependent epimerase/dehydratase family protein [Acidobacteria bacterium]|nr:NAD-dependent epimerase/dehydratase family protein [Acidobacteriota bacterium]
MERILVVGATGQLGLASIHELLARGQKVRALIRQPQSASTFESIGVETALGDLTDPASLRNALKGISHIVATANAAVPTRPSDTFAAVERDGYRNLIEAAIAAKVSRFVQMSVRFPATLRLSPFFQYKRETAERLRQSGLDHVIFQSDIFMDLAFSMLGSSIPLRGSHNATILRPFNFTRNFFQSIQDSIEKKRVARIPGNGMTRHGFICISDVAQALAAASIGGPSGTFALAGSESLSFLEIVHLYEKLLNLQLKVSSTPAWIFRCISLLMAPFNPAGANIMWMNYLSATESTSADQGTAAQFGLTLTTAETFLLKELAIPAAQS